MENSIEEDIKILEKFKNDEMQRDKLERDVRCGGWKIGDIYKCLELDNAIDNILSDYKRVLKENEELKFEERSRIIGKYGDAEIHDVINRTLSNDYIPIQKVKGKIEELDIAISECIYLDEDNEKYKKAVEKDKLCLLNQKRALQELLEEGDLE